MSQNSGPGNGYKIAATLLLAYGIIASFLVTIPAFSTAISTGIISAIVCLACIIGGIVCWKKYKAIRRDYVCKPKKQENDSSPVHESKSSIDRSGSKMSISSHPTASNTYVFSANYINRCKTRFIAIDTETTGFDPSRDRIIEISAVVFEDFLPTKSFSTLINPGMHIPAAASKVNGIYDADVQNSPSESTAIHNFVQFIGADALSGETVIVAHNATFDIKFILFALSRAGIEASLYFQDTLYMARHWNIDTKDKKLGTLAEYFGISQQNAHRACDDARVCGEIFCKLIQQQLDSQHAKFDALTQTEKEFCQWVKKTLVAGKCNTDILTFHSSTYLSVNCLYNVVKAKPKARRPYILVNSTAPLPSSVETAPATKSEGSDFIRIFYQSPAELEFLGQWLISNYQEKYKTAIAFSDQSTRNARELAKCVELQITI